MSSFFCQFITKSLGNFDRNTKMSSIFCQFITKSLGNFDRKNQNVKFFGQFIIKLLGNFDPNTKMGPFFILPLFLVPKLRSVAQNEWKKHVYFFLLLVQKNGILLP